ncbi:MAG: DNA-3-methyladenine glycosylase I [Parvibaculum sp.]|uniref:DNA-3-methyladenine glycosylase I n=1 Tax=Parvibaculum sp. TaxID=2024848 RepID=UPI003263FDE2
MEKFEKIFARAAKRHGGAKAVEAELPKPKSAAALKKIPDDRWLAGMTKAVFQAGFVWRVIENKWPGFEDAFDGFDPHRIAFYADEDIERLAGDTRIVRNGAKILATRDNARFVCDLAEEFGSAGAFFGGSKPENFAGLLDTMKKRGNRLSGASAQFFLRQMGVDGWVMSPSVVAALIAAGVVDKAPTSAKAMKAVQEAFNVWRKESGRPLMAISRTLAMSADPD